MKPHAITNIGSATPPQAEHQHQGATYVDKPGRMTCQFVSWPGSFLTNTAGKKKSSQLGGFNVIFKVEGEV